MLRQLTTKMKAMLAPFEKTTPNRGPLEHRYLLGLGLLTEKQAASLEIDAQSVMVSYPARAYTFFLQKEVLPLAVLRDVSRCKASH